jgi:archaemetzincin
VRLAIALGLVLILLIGAAGAIFWAARPEPVRPREAAPPPPSSQEAPVGNPSAPWKPQAQVEKDPPSWYSPALFKKMGEPQPGDWMIAHPERPQTFEEFVRSAPIRPTRGRHTISLAPVGPFPAKDRERMATLREYLELYYTVPVSLSTAAPLEGVTSRERQVGGRKYRQYLTGDIMSKVLRLRLPNDGLCILGVTMEDLYPEASWNYVFGEASLSSRVGVYSLVRFYPAFWGRAETPVDAQRGLWRSLQTLVHETGHMFGVLHCQKYECVMNGSNSLEESDRRPIHLCPDCLKKFRWNIGFDVVERYEGLKTFYEKNAMKDGEAFLAGRLRECRGEAAGPGPAKP